MKTNKKSTLVSIFNGKRTETPLGNKNDSAYIAAQFVSKLLKSFFK